MRTLLLPLACFGLIAQTTFTQIKVAPVPADSHELVAGLVQIAATPQDRASALSLLERARQNSDMHMSGASPFALKVSFSVTGTFLTSLLGRRRLPSENDASRRPKGSRAI